jgi:hypothetical protein
MNSNEKFLIRFLIMMVFHGDESRWARPLSVVDGAYLHGGLRNLLVHGEQDIQKI